MGRPRSLPKATQQEIIEAIQAASKSLGRLPSKAEFLAQTKIGEYTINHVCGTWCNAVRAAGFKSYQKPKPKASEDLIVDWARAVRTLGRPPSQSDYNKIAEFSWLHWKQTFGSWSAAPRAFFEFAHGKPEWDDVVAILEAIAAKDAEPEQKHSLALETKILLTDPPASLLRLKDDWHKWLRERPVSQYTELTFGDPIDFRRLRNAPVNESGVVLLFGMLAAEFGLIIEAIQPAFPDCEAKFRGEDGKWRRLRIEFEYESRNFLIHGHNASECDVIVCWRHNWKECPLRVIELSSAVKELKAA